jgi:hypothetical protein
MPDQRQLRAVGEEPGRGQAQRDFLERAAIGLAAEETAGAPVGQAAAQHLAFRVHVPQFIVGAAGKRRIGGPPLVGRGGIEEAPVHVGREAREVMFQPLLAILAAQQRGPLRPVHGHGGETGGRDALGGRCDAFLRVFDVGQPAHAHAVDVLFLRAYALRVFCAAGAAVGAAPVQTHALEGLGGGGLAIEPVAVAEDQQ